MKKAIKIVFITILLIIVIINVSIIIQTKLKPNSVPKIFGVKPFIVLSGSMESELYKGDVLLQLKKTFILCILLIVIIGTGIIWILFGNKKLSIEERRELEKYRRDYKK